MNDDPLQCQGCESFVRVRRYGYCEGRMKSSALLTDEMPRAASNNECPECRESHLAQIRREIAAARAGTPRFSSLSREELATAEAVVRDRERLSGNLDAMQGEFPSGETIVVPAKPTSDDPMLVDWHR